jgi:HEAT repeat protein
VRIVLPDQGGPCVFADRFDRAVAELGVDHRAKEALRSLMAAGTNATPAVRRGLQHANPRIRARCCDVLDHFLDEDAIPELMENLSHDDPEVRMRAMHALACDRCKEGSCRPAENDVVGAAMRLLATDPDRHVRTQAAHALGPAVHRRRDALEALVAAYESDVDSLVRKVAGWYCPSGPIFERLRPRPQRRPHSASDVA